MLLRTLLLCFSCVITCTSRAGADKIGLFSTPDCATCKLVIPSGESRVFYASLIRAGYEMTSTASFRIGGLPAGWSYEVTAGEGLQLSGDPFGAGVFVGFPYPAPAGDCLSLFAVRLTATSVQGEVGLSVERDLLTSIGCPFTYTLCGADCGLFDCVETSTLYINSVHDCTTGTETMSWSAAKVLYR